MIGFDDFLSILPFESCQTSNLVGLRALIKRWQNTIHTFHFNFGEITLDLVNFYLITSLPFTEVQVLLIVVYILPALMVRVRDISLDY